MTAAKAATPVVPSMIRLTATVVMRAAHQHQDDPDDVSCHAQGDAMPGTGQSSNGANAVAHARAASR